MLGPAMLGQSALMQTLKLLNFYNQGKVLSMVP